MVCSGIGSKDIPELTLGNFNASFVRVLGAFCGDDGEPGK